MLLNRHFVSSRVEALDFKAFMRREQRVTQKCPIPMTSRITTPLFSFIPLHPAAMIDPVFIAIAAGVLFVALIEKGLADTGNVSIAAFISAFLRISFPAVGLTAIWFLVNNLKFLFW